MSPVFHVKLNAENTTLRVSVTVPIVDLFILFGFSCFAYVELASV